MVCFNVNKFLHILLGISSEDARIINKKRLEIKSGACA